MPPNRGELRPNKIMKYVAHDFEGAARRAVDANGSGCSSVIGNLASQTERAPRSMRAYSADRGSTRRRGGAHAGLPRGAAGQRMSRANMTRTLCQLDYAPLTLVQHFAQISGSASSASQSSNGLVTTALESMCLSDDVLHVGLCIRSRALFV